MPKKKTYQDRSVITEQMQPDASTVEKSVDKLSRSADLSLPVNPTTNRRVILSPWLGKGIDEWVFVVVRSLDAMLHSGEYSPTTISRGGAAAKIFFEFLTNIPEQVSPNPLHNNFIIRYIRWLKFRYGDDTSTAKGRYTAIKTILLNAIDRGIILREKSEMNQALFPANPFPGTNAKLRGGEPFSKNELQRLANALKIDLIAIHQGQFNGTESEATTVSFLVIALRTGTNLIPLLELTRDCLSENPFSPNMMVMQVFKRRGNATHLRALRFSEEQQTSRIVPMDGVAVLRKVLERNSHLLSDAKVSIKNRLWIYRSKSMRNNYGVSVLDSTSVFRGIASIVKRHSLVADNGEPLLINTQRLRKTMENRLWKISHGDIMSVATVMGHSPEVADHHYLRMTEDMKSEAAQFVGVALPGILRGDGTADEHIPEQLQKVLQNTPAGCCSNTLNGHFAPSDGINHCDKFTKCLVCPNFVVVGTVKDLHRLFSFQMFLRADIEYMKSDELVEWRELRFQQISLIDKFTAEKFPSTVVEKAKLTAKTFPHPFWAARIEFSKRANGGFDEK